MTKRPAFLQDNVAKSARDLLAAFRRLSMKEAGEVDLWLLQHRNFGSLSSAETYLYDWINEHDMEQAS
jgi:hypothetical protein